MSSRSVSFFNQKFIGSRRKIKHNQINGKKRRGQARGKKIVINPKIINTFKKEGVPLILNKASLFFFNKPLKNMDISSIAGTTVAKAIK
jgi:hypothetical protein